ncbi:MAG TPA: class I SAM-dependent methyltransferase [Candidatus Paceibacterota bacterium]|nr:class I SAM-dependent methyltransferase [Candidatus Paceibacterota bacterium]
MIQCLDLELDSFILNAQNKIMSIKGLIRRIKRRFFPYYRVIRKPENGKAAAYSKSWQQPRLAQKQTLKAVAQLDNWKEIDHMRVGVEAIKATGLVNPKVLEVGCSAGYFSEVFKLAGLDVQYEGCDYSSEFIKLAKERYPNIPFAVNDATQLNYQNDSFDIVFSGGCLLHILDYRQAIREAARVARDFVIFQRTPVILKSPTTYTQKTAYEVPMIEIWFNETELLDLIRQEGLTVEKIFTFGEKKYIAEPVFIKTYVCRKIKTNL